MTDLAETINWRRHDARLSSSGQPTQAQLALIEGAGTRHIINFGPHSNKGALEDEPGDVAALGMSYTHIPVDFENPTEADFNSFRAALTELQQQPLHVHCIFNARVSAFFYRLAVEGGDEPAPQAFARMDGIWRPGGVWAAFIGKPEDADKPNRFQGYDYD